MNKVGIIYGHLEYITAIWYIFGHLVYFWPFDNLVAIWYASPRFGTLNKAKSGNPVVAFVLNFLVRVFEHWKHILNHVPTYVHMDQLT
jgi:hypothetical protein